MQDWKVEASKVQKSSQNTNIFMNASSTNEATFLGGGGGEFINDLPKISEKYFVIYGFK